MIIVKKNNYTKILNILNIVLYMENLDLNIQNYELEDILKLFKLPADFTQEHLKNAYRISLKTHPDKSGLEPRFFIFFQKAYSILEKIFHFRNKKKTTSTEYVPEVLNGENANLLRKLDGKSISEFNKWFNELFEKTRVSDNENDTGYGDWYNNYKDKHEPKIAKQDFGREFEKKKKECKALVVKEELYEMGGNSGYSLDREGPKEYSSDLFSNLQYEDLKKAHTETVIPITKDDFDNKKKFKNLENYKRYRSEQNTAPLSLKQSEQYLREKENKINEYDTRRVYNIIKKDEEVEKANSRWWGALKLLQ